MEFLLHLMTIIFYRRMENELKSEWEKHRLTKDELTKTKLNLQYTKTQAAVSYYRSYQFFEKL